MNKQTFNLRLPVFAAPMFLISGPEMVLAACKAGIIGAFPTPNARPIETLDVWMKQITEGLARARDEQPMATIGPWCANLVTHSSNTRSPEDMALIAKYKPPIVVTALGSPKPAIEVVHSYGGLVFADVIDIKLAKKAVAAGADGLASVIVGGGISDGWGIAGAIACGADYVYMGTRFIPTLESMAAPAYKQMVVDSTVDDLIVSAGITGTAASWLKPSLRALGIDPDNMPSAPERQYDSSKPVAARKWMDVWAAGQGVGAIKAIEPLALVVDQLADEYAQATKRIKKLPY
jgi:nitronate monooxygenase